MVEVVEGVEGMVTCMVVTIPKSVTTALEKDPNDAWSNQGEINSVYTLPYGF